MIQIFKEEDIDSFPKNKWGIPEPSTEEAMRCTDHTYSGKIDLVLVPGVAFDANCGRLGHGKGYYGELI